jgi:hypothetical protein
MLVKNIKMYYQVLKKKDIKMSNPYKIQCLKGIFAIFSSNYVEIVD